MRKLMGFGVAAAWAAAQMAASAQGNGSVTGVVSAASKTLTPIRVTFDQKVCGHELPDEAVVTDAQGHLANAVVILTGLQARYAAADTLVSNEKCRFAPRVQVVRANANIKTTSHDPVLHTTNAASEAGKTLFNVALPFPGLSITKPIGAAGVVRLTCNTHPWMRGFVVVTDEMAAVTGVDGRFSLADVPPGTYQLRVWHEALKGAPRRITVVSGKADDVALQMK